MPQGKQGYADRQFESPERFLSPLDSQEAARLLSAAADAVLVLDADGVIRDLAFASDEWLARGCPEWLGKHWLDTVTVESRPKIEALLAAKDIDATGQTPWRQVNHPVPGGVDLAVSYSVVPLAGDTGRSGYRLAFGRDLSQQMALQQRLVSSQLAMERDFWRLRQVETRYRLLFQVTAEAVLVLDGQSERVEEANPAALALLGDRVRRSGWSLAEALDGHGQTQFRQTIERLRAGGRAEPVNARLLQGNKPVLITASLFRQENTPYFLVRLSAPTEAGNGPARGETQQMLALMEQAPDAFVITDPGGRILGVNRAFLEATHLGGIDAARGESLAKWLGRTAVDLNVLIANLRQHGAVRLFATQLRDEYGASTDVEISAVAVADSDPPCLGFTIRDVTHRLSSDSRGRKELPRSASQMTELVGRLPLKDIVRDTTDLIEQLCIEAALQLTGDNRASAAEMLGLSRQSLYIKLRRYGIGDSAGDDESTPAS